MYQKDKTTEVKQDSDRIRSAMWHETKTAQKAPAALRTLRQMGQDDAEMLDMLGLTEHAKVSV